MCRKSVSLKKMSVLLGCMLLILSCDENRARLTDTPTKGTITVVVDETYKPLMDSEKMVFESYYPDAHIHLVYKPALEAMNQFNNDSVRLIITSVPMDSSYLYQYFEKKKYYPQTTVLAKDAIAIIANNSRKGLQITTDEIAKICRGEITDFSKLEKGKTGGKITLVFDNAQSSTVQYIQDSVMKGGTITKNAFAQKTNEEVIAYVRKNPNALGIIGVNWISDSQDEDNLEFSKDIFPVEIRNVDSSAYYYAPHPGYIATHLYPMRRYMNATLKENGAALGRGFVNFISGEIGQRIVLKAGLVPAKVVTRVVETRPNM